MDKNVKNSLLLASGAVAGGYGGSWIAQRVCTAMGCSLGPWGSAIGAILGAMAGSALTKSMMADEPLMPDFDADAVSAAVSEVVDQ
jgi:hypothetical protein